jgi:RNA 3'-terminal phosphate cyclase
MIIFMALASGESVLRCGSLTLHTESAIHVAQQLTGAQFLIMINVQDQMIIFMALASGESMLRCGSLTLHTESAIHVAQQLTGAHFSVRQETPHISPLGLLSTGILTNFGDPDPEPACFGPPRSGSPDQEK